MRYKNIKILGIMLSLVMTMMLPVEAHAKSANQVIYEHIMQYQTKEESKDIANAIIYYSEKHKVDPILITALYTVESHFNQSAISSAGAVGISQLMPSTAQDLGVNPNNRYENIEGGIRYLAYLIALFKPNGNKTYTYAIAAYNAGAGSIIAAHGVPKIIETRNEINQVYQVQQILLRKMRNE